MRKVLVVCAALALCAGPALAQQQSQDLAPAPAAAAAPTPAPQADAPQPRKPAPSLYVSTDEVRRQVQAAAADERKSEAQVGSQNFLYIVAAIVVGVIIAALILD